jgi:hypothetical protein
MDFFIECIGASLESLKAALNPKKKAAKKKAAKKKAGGKKTPRKKTASEESPAA